MRSCLLTTSFLLANVLSTPTEAQWTPTNGPYSAPVLSMAANATTLFVGTETGLFLTTDVGKTWLPASGGIPNTGVQALATHGSSIYAGTSDDGLFRSTDDGASWKEIDQGRLGYVRALAASDSFLFVAIHDTVYRTSEGGSAGQLITTSPLQGEVLTLFASDVDLVAGTVSGVFRSTDWGLHWLARSQGLPNAGILALSKADTNLFAGVNLWGIYRSTNNGQEWTPVNNGMPASRVQAFAVLSSGLYAGTYRAGVYRSSNEGDSWTSVKTGLWNRDVRALVPLGDTLFAGAYYGGVFRTTNAGTNWEPASVGITQSFIQNLSLDSNYLFAGTSSGLFRSTDAGDSWIELELGRPAVENITAAVARSRSTGTGILFFGTQYGVIYQSTDDGMSWLPADTVTPSDGIGAFAVSGDNVVAAGTFNAFVRTDSSGKWVTVPFGYSTDAVADLASSGNDLFAAAAYQGVFRSTDHGWTWAASNTGIADVDVHSIAAGETYLLAGTERTRYLNSQGVYRSTDKGSTWTHVDWTLDWIGALKIIDARVFAGTANGVFVSSDTGSTWEYVGVGMEGATVETLESDGEFLYAGTSGRGVWRRPLTEMITSVAQTGADLPNQLSLCQNYPNPFNPTTTIRYGLPSRSHVLLAVYNTLGQKVAELVNADVDAGYHEVQFNARNLASGVYFYRLTAGSFVETKKLLLVR